MDEKCRLVLGTAASLRPKNRMIMIIFSFIFLSSPFFILHSLKLVCSPLKFSFNTGFIEKAAVGSHESPQFHKDLVPWMRKKRIKEEEKKEKEEGWWKTK